MNFNVEIKELDNAFDVELGGAGIPVGTHKHDELANRDLPNQHPIEAIANLESELDKRLQEVPALTNWEIENILKERIK